MVKLLLHHETFMTQSFHDHLTIHSIFPIHVIVTEGTFLPGELEKHIGTTHKMYCGFTEENLLDRR
jgi:hypothetical protein